MSRLFVTLETARDRAFSDQRALIRSLKNPVGFKHSYWQGRPVGTYIHSDGKSFWLSPKYPVDLLRGTLVNPTAQLFSGTSATLAPVDLKDAAGIAITLVSGWRDAEINYRALFSMWSRQLAVAVYVQLAMENHPWHRRFWTHTYEQCLAVDRKLGDAICDAAH